MIHCLHHAIFDSQIALRIIALHDTGDEKRISFTESVDLDRSFIGNRLVIKFGIFIDCYQSADIAYQLGLIVKSASYTPCYPNRHRSILPEVRSILA